MEQIAISEKSKRKKKKFIFPAIFIHLKNVKGLILVVVPWDGTSRHKSRRYWTVIWRDCDLKSGEIRDKFDTCRDFQIVFARSILELGRKTQKIDAKF